VTVDSTALRAPSARLLSGIRGSIPRDEFFAGLYILGCANARARTRSVALAMPRLAGYLLP
jgi:hypothetical protein